MTILLFLFVSILFGQETRRYRVIINSVPKGADVYVKGKQVGRTPFGFWAPAGARFSLELRKTGYESWRNKYIANKDIVLDIPLTGLGDFAPQGVQHPLVLNTLPEDANVWINGELKGKTPFRLPVTEGSELNIILTKNGYQEWIRNLTVTEAIRETVQLQQIKKSNLKYWLIPGFALVSYGLIKYFASEEDPEPEEITYPWPAPPSRP